MAGSCDICGCPFEGERTKGAHYYQQPAGPAFPLGQVELTLCTDCAPPSHPLEAFTYWILGYMEERERRYRRPGEQAFRAQQKRLEDEARDD